MITNQTTYLLSSGDCFVLKPDGEYICSHNPENPLTLVFVHFDYKDNSKDFGFYRRLDN